MYKIKSYFRIVVVIGLVFGIFFAAGAGLSSLFFTVAEQAGTATAATTIEDNKRTNILLLGVDSRPGDTHPRSDTIILASVDPNLKKVALVSIPRDTRIEGAAGSGFDKINSANAVGGSELAVKKVEGLMGEKIDYYVQMDFQGFKNIVDALGGVTINVEQRMYKPLEDIDLKPGLQKLDGRDALGFVRFRDYAMGDIERTAHQQEFIKALGQEVLKPANIVKLPGIIKEVNANVETNLRLADMLKLATWAPGFSAESIVAQTLPGYFYDERNAQGVLVQSYWIADSKQVQTLLDNMLSGQTVAVVVDTPTTTAKKTTATSATDTKAKTQAEIEKANKERANLPSAGHGIKI